MAQSQIEGNFIERMIDGFGSFMEGVVGGLGRIFGSSNERFVRSLGFLRYRDGSTAIAPGSLLAQVNALEEHMKSLSDDELKALTPVFRQRLADGETLMDLLPEAFAACREAAFRTKNMRHFDTQIIGGIVLHQGKIAEMVTGEGKTLVATLPAYLNALTGQGVHIITVNDYLARRDCEWMSPIYHALGITCGFIQSDMENVPRRQAYECDITYGTNSEFGFDYLRDNMKPARWGDPAYEPGAQQVQRGLHYAIIDEVDNILVDEARTPLIISGSAFGDLRRYARANDIAAQLSELEKRAKARGLVPARVAPEQEKPEDETAPRQEGEAANEGEADDGPVADEKQVREGYYFEVKEKERTCHLTDEGVRKAEELAGVESFYTAGNMEWPHLIDNALKAHHLYQKDKQYVVMRHPETNEMSVIIVDEFTGRLMIGRQWSDGLHQAVEAKHTREGVKIKEETQTLATITLQNYFKLYDKIAGMTGTAMTEANEFWKIYKLEVIAIPTNKPLIRDNYPDVIYLYAKEKWEAVLTEIERMHKWDLLRMADGSEVLGTIKKETEEELEFLDKDAKQKRTVPLAEIEEIERRGRPILIGTIDVDKSEMLSKMLSRHGIKHELLNAKPEYAAREAEIVAQAGRIGAVTISTNMAGRGTDIILGGNPETLAWARLRDKYPTRLDVPPDVWKKTVDDIREKEKMDEEGRQVAAMGGLHIVGTERHEARRIDNQLRGRAGRQGDPGSGRFYLSLEDDLMRIFAGEWVRNFLERMGMQRDEPIVSRMVSRRIESAQKKVEERNFDIRKNLLEYDEVMDHQRKRVYSYRQDVLEGGNCKARVLKMIEEQLDVALGRFLDDDYGSSSFAELASQRLGVEFGAGDFSRAEFEDADKSARDKASRMVPTQIHEAMEENLNPDVEQSEWNWQAMANHVNGRWGLKTNDRQLKQIGRDNLSTYLIEQAEKSIAAVDLSKGKSYLLPDWGRRSLCDWVYYKFQIKIDPASLADLGEPIIKERLLDEIGKLYRQKEIEFPVTVAMARFMSDRQHSGPGGQRYDREGLYRWSLQRFGKQDESAKAEGETAAVAASEGGGTAVAVAPALSLAAYGLSEEDFRTQSRVKLNEALMDISHKSYPKIGHKEIDAKLAEAFQGASVSEEEDAREVAEWMKAELDLDVPVEMLTGVSEERARDILWTAFDDRHRPEMKRMERSLLLNQLDNSWKNHLYTMDHLRQGIGLVGYAQIDPKTEYKRQGMREFDQMWEALQDKVSDIVFRMEDDESFQESVWSIDSVSHASGPSMQSFQSEGTASQHTAVKKEPIRNRTARVGRNDPCPCGSGKKYKNCCMRKAAG
ncbi:MAG: preprotein translocase subunit SecA [Planctomycetes bacterium]|nr:preprotein translocase subunit SecA [Planctomycetota bacterium]